MVQLTINGKAVTAEAGTSVLEAARQNQIIIPSLCWLEGVHQVGACRICVVEVEGARNLQASCMLPVREGLSVRTNTPRVRHARRVLYELMLSDHPRDCLSCFRNRRCEFQKLGELIQVDEFRFEGEVSKHFVDDSSPSIIRDSSKCILCRRCITACNQVQGVGVLNVQKRGFHSFIGPADLPLNSTNCSNCGQCIMVCPVAALKTKGETPRIWAALNDPKKTTIVQTHRRCASHSVRNSARTGHAGDGQMASALRTIGFDHVFDTNFAADLTIVEEGLRVPAAAWRRSPASRRCCR
jgi:NADH-quinone oxidoreductase subunit G/NADP-reducing hydrogenase subunit HndD